MRQIIISMIDDLYRAFDKKTVTTHIRTRTARRLQNIRNLKKSLQQHSVSQKQCSPLQTAGLILDDSILVITCSQLAQNPQNRAVQADFEGDFFE